MSLTVQRLPCAHDKAPATTVGRVGSCRQPSTWHLPESSLIAPVTTHDAQLHSPLKKAAQSSAALRLPCSSGLGIGGACVCSNVQPNSCTCRLQMRTQAVLAAVA